MLINFHNSLDCLQGVRFRNLKLLFPHLTLHLYSASCSKTEVKRQQNNTNAGTARFHKERWFFSSPFGKWRTRKDWKAWKGKNEGRFLRALLRWRVQGVSKDKVSTDKEKKNPELNTGMHKTVFSSRTRWQGILE